jgi:hypothetical protein
LNLSGYGATTFGAAARAGESLLVDPIYIKGTLGEVTPFPAAPNVCVSYPNLQDWWNRFPNLHKLHGHKRTMIDLKPLYEDQKRTHGESVMRRLRRISHWDTGKAVLAELRARRDYSVHIFPFSFVPSIDGPLRNSLGLTEQIHIPQTRWERAHGLKPRGTKFHARGVYWSDGDQPSAADIYYSEEICKDSEADGVLLHELVHGLRMISGLDIEAQMRGGYPNSEEFIANTIEMIFRSERGLPVTDYVGHPTDQASVLKLPLARTLITVLCHRQMSLALRLSKVEADFNPIRPIAEKLFVIDL